MVLRLRGSDAGSVTANDATTFYRLASDGNTDAVEVIAQRIRWSEGLQTSDPQAGNHLSATPVAISLTDLLEYHCPKSGLTPLMAAVVKGHLAVTRQLLEYGAAVDAVDAQKGRTALHRAIKGSVMMYPMDAKIVTLLLDSGANPFCADKKGCTAVDYAFLRRMSMSARVPNSFELIVRGFLQNAVFAGPFEVKLSRILGLSKGWKKLYCALVPFSPAVGTEATELQLMFIDESALTLVDKVVVTDCRSEACATRARLHIDLIVRPQTRMMEVYMTDAGDQQMKVQLRALDESLAESGRLHKLTELAAIDPAEAAEIPARRRAGGLSFRSSTNPAAFHVGQGNSDTAHMHRNSVPAVERSQDSPRDVHRPRDMARQSMPVMRNLMSRSTSRDRNTASAADEEHMEVTRAVAPTGGLPGVAEAPEGVGDALAAAREDHRSRRLLVQRSDSAKMGPLEMLPEVV